MVNEDPVEVLVDFLSNPLDSSDEIFYKFSSLPGARIFGERPSRYLYIPGNRNNKVLLVAHADTAFSNFMYFHRQPTKTQLHIHNGIIRNIDMVDKDRCGLGADDRAGCAIIWLLRDLGHSILITDGEEIGGAGSTFLTKNQEFMKELYKKHQFVIQLDRRGDLNYKTYHVGIPSFERYIEQSMPNYKMSGRHSFTDICIICPRIGLCGVNLSVGYYHEHTEYEQLVIHEWKRTLNLLNSWLTIKKIPKYILPMSNNVGFFSSVYHTLKSKIYSPKPNFENMEADALNEYLRTL